ncbi:MAG: AAA family ATPase [Acidobacteriota bacterium]
MSGPDLTLDDHEIPWTEWAPPDTAGADVAPPAPAAAFPSNWTLLDDVQLLDLPDPQWIIEDVIQRNGVGVIYSPPGSGKTTLVAGLLTAICLGRPWFGHVVQTPGACLYVAAEDRTGFKQRARAAKRAALAPLDQPIGLYTFPEAVDIRDGAAVQRFAQFLLAGTYRQPLVCLVIDTYAASTSGGNENSSEDTTLAMVNAQFLRDALNVTVILIHHTNAAGSRERGHSGMRGAADFMLSMTPVDDLVHLECSKQRNAAPFERIGLKLVPAPDGSGCVMRLASEVLASSTLTPAQSKAYFALQDTFGAEGATKAEWQKACHELAERTFYHVAKVLTEQGYVATLGTKYRITAKEPRP